MEFNSNQFELLSESQALNFMRLSARIDATASRVQTAVTMKQVMNTLYNIETNCSYLHMKGC